MFIEKKIYVFIEGENWFTPCVHRTKKGFTHVFIEKPWVFNFIMQIVIMMGMVVFNARSFYAKLNLILVCIYKHVTIFKLF